jgi:hypothetical protein
LTPRDPANTREPIKRSLTLPTHLRNSELLSGILPTLRTSFAIYVNSSMPTTGQTTQASDDTKAARRLLANSAAILREVEESALVQRHKRSYPTFAPSEVKTGTVLGTGGYCSVHEVLDFEWAESGSTEHDQRVASPDSSHVEESREPHLDNPVILPVKRELLDLLVGGNDEDEGEHPHYDVNAARRLMKDHVLRHGEARYAIKRLKKELKGELERARAMLDLAIEAKFLAALW